MPGTSVLVLGATGPAGICLVRELLHRNIQTTVYARSPSKLPEDVAASHLIEVIKGEMDDKEALSSAVAKSRLILSLLGPSINTPVPETTFSDMYRNIFNMMREHGVRRIFAMGTPSIYHESDHTSVMRWFAIRCLRLLYHGAYRNIICIQEAFDDKEATRDIDWTVFRIGQIPGESDEASWRADREDGEMYAGPVGAPGWTFTQKRAALTRWLVDVSESNHPELIGKMPAVSRKAGS